MKKRHQQKMIVLSIVLLLVFNVPFILVFNKLGDLFGFPIFYFSVFAIWILSIFSSGTTLYRHYVYGKDYD